MANQYTFGDKLQGIGAVLGGTAPQFQKQMGELSTERQKAMYQDADAALKMASRGDLPGVIRLIEDRISMIQRLNGDPTESLQALNFARAAQSGDTASGEKLMQGLTISQQQGIDLGFIPAPVAPEEYTLGQGDTRMRGSEVIARGADKSTNPLVNINTGDQSQDLRRGLYTKVVESIPGDMTKAQQQITLADEAQTIANLMNNEDPSLFMRYIQNNYPEFGVSVFDQSGIMSTATALANRLAPTMREEGSGSTSDGEMRQYLLSLPNLMQSNNGRSLTAQMFQAKADIEKKRVDLYNKYINEEINERELTQNLFELNGKSLFTPERKRKINSIVPGFFNNTPEATFIPPPGSGIERTVDDNG